MPQRGTTFALAQPDQLQPHVDEPRANKRRRRKIEVAGTSKGGQVQEDQEDQEELESEVHEEAMDPTALAAYKKKTTPATAQQWYRMSQCARTFLKRLSGIDPRGRVVAIAMAPHHRTIFGWGGPGKESPAWLADTVFLVEKAASLQDLDRQLGVEVIAGAVKAYKDRSSGLVAPRGGARVQCEARTLLLRTFCDRVISMGIIGTARQISSNLLQILWIYLTRPAAGLVMAHNLSVPSPS